DQPVRLTDAPSARLVGSGRLDRLGIVNGRRVATVETSYVLPVHAQSASSRIEGMATTDISATRSVSDGAVETVRAHTTGRFRLTVDPPPGVTGSPVTGTMTVDVRSTTHRTS